MHLADLETFVDVMRHRNFTDVARARDVAPSSVSRVITALEKELGFKLFQRSTRKLEPTEAGMVYFARIEPLLAELVSANQIAADLIEEPRGSLRVTAPIVYGEKCIVPLLPRLTEKYPSLSIELMLSDVFVDLIEERIDIAVRLGTLQDSSYIARQIQHLEYSICASPEYLRKQGTPALPAELSKHNCLLFPRTGYNMNWHFKDAAGAVTEVPITGNCLVTNSQAIKQCALAGMGLALLPNWLVDNDIQSGALVKLFGQFEVTATDYDSGIWVLYPSRDYVPLKTRVFMDHFVQSVL